MTKSISQTLHDLASAEGSLLAWKVCDHEGQIENYNWENLEKKIFKRAQSLWEFGIRPGTKVLLWSEPNAESLGLDWALESLGASTLWVPSTLKGPEIEPHFWNFSPRFVLSHSHATNWEFFNKREDLTVIQFSNSSTSNLEIKLGLQTKVEDLNYENWIELKNSLPSVEPLWSLTQGIVNNPKLVSHSKDNVEFALNSLDFILNKNGDSNLFGLEWQSSTLWHRLLSRWALNKKKLLHLGNSHFLLGDSPASTPSIYLFLTLPQTEKLFLSFLDPLFGVIPASKKTWQELKDRLLQALPHEGSRSWVQDKLKPLEISVIKKFIDKNLTGSIAGICVLNGSLEPVVRESFESLGISITELYSLTELCGPTAVCDINLGVKSKNKKLIQRRPLPGVTVRVLQSGELFLKSPGLSPTAPVNEQGFFGTHDIGSLFPEGGFVVEGRKGEVLTLTTGQKVDPRLLKRVFSKESLLSRVFVFGEGKPFVGALLTLKPDKARKVADQLQIPFSSVPDLIDHPSFLEFLKKRIQELNSGLKDFEKIKRYAVLKQDFSRQGGELSYDGQLRIQFCMQKYAQHIEQIYKGKVI